MSVFYGIRLSEELDAKIQAHPLYAKGKTAVIAEALQAYFAIPNVSRPKITKRAADDPTENRVGNLKPTKGVKPRPPQIDLPQARPPMPQRPNRPAKPPGEWCPTSKCPHNWMNSFVCEQNGGGCKR